MKKFSVLAVLGVAVLAGVAIAADDIKSGLAIGERVGAFNVRDITGPEKGNSLCYRCQYGDRPVVAIFARDVNPAVGELVKKIDDTVAKNGDKKMAAFAVFMTSDVDAIEPKLETLAKAAKLSKTPLTLSESPNGPSNYKLAKDADVTVLMWVDNELKVNQAFAKGKLDKASIDTIVADTKKILAD